MPRERRGAVIVGVIMGIGIGTAMAQLRRRQHHAPRPRQRVREGMQLAPRDRAQHRRDGIVLVGDLGPGRRSGLPEQRREGLDGAGEGVHRCGEFPRGVAGEGGGEGAEGVEGGFDHRGGHVVLGEADGDLDVVAGLGRRDDGEVREGVVRAQEADSVVALVQLEGHVLGEVLVLDDAAEVGPGGPVGAFLHHFAEAERFEGHACHVLVLDPPQQVQHAPFGRLELDPHGDDVQAGSDDAFDAVDAGVAPADEVAEDDVCAVAELGEDEGPGRFEDGGGGDFFGGQGGEADGFLEDGGWEVGAGVFGLVAVDDVGH